MSHGSDELLVLGCLAEEVRIIHALKWLMSWYVDVSGALEPLVAL